MKRFVLFVLLLVLVVFVNFEYSDAQNYTENMGKTILQEYIAGLQKKTDVTPLVIKIKNMYEAANAKERKEFKEIIVENISEQLLSNQKEFSHSLINVYKMVAEPDDSKLPMLNYFLGIMYTEQNDSINLKKTIEAMERCTTHSEELSEYLFILNNNLRQIRDYISPSHDMNGKWTTDAFYKTPWNIYVFPKYIIESKELDGHSQFIINGSTPACYEFNYGDLMHYQLLNSPSQIVKEYSNDSLYIFWSSEKLSKTDIGIVNNARDMAGTIGTGIAQGMADGSATFSSNLLGGLTGGLVEIGLNELFNSLFSTKKKLVLVEARLKRISHNIFQGVFSFKRAKLNATSTDKLKFIEEIDTVTLMRWSKECDALFMQWDGDPYFGGNDYNTLGLKGAARKTAKRTKKNTQTEFGQAYLNYKKQKKGKDKWAYLIDYNTKQIDKIRKWCLENQ